MSHVPSRANARWSSGEQFELPFPIAGLPNNGAAVGMNPPLTCSGASLALARKWLAGPGSGHVVSSPMLWPRSW